MWNNLSDKRPAEGKPVIVLVENKPDIGYYCDGGFYTLRLDEHLGVLRKIYLGRLELWAEYITPER